MRLRKNVIGAVLLAVILPVVAARAETSANILVAVGAASLVAGDPPQPATSAASPVDAGTMSVKSVEISGASALSPADVSAAVSAVAVGAKGDAKTIQSASRAAIDLYRRRGYPVAQVTAAEITSSGILRLTIAEGTIQRVVVRGDRKTRLSTIVRILSLKAGDVYSETSARNDRNRLARLGIFEEVIISAQAPGTEDTDIQPISSVSGKGSDVHLPPDQGQGATPDNSAAKDNPVDNPSGSNRKTGEKQAVIAPGIPAAPITDVDEVGQVDLVVRVKEQQTFNVAATVGYADQIGPVGYVDLSELNVAGTAQRVDLEWQRISESYVSTDGTTAQDTSRQAFDFLYEKPALNARATSLGLSIYDKNTVFLPYFAGSDQTFRTFEKRSGATVRMGRAIRPGLTGFMSLRRADVGYDAFENYYTGPQPPEYFVATAAARIAAVGGEIVADGRDVVDNPRRGYFDSVRYEDASDILGGNREFSQTTADLRFYIPVNGSKDGPIFAVRLLGGYSSGDLPLSEFYFLGGYELLRGYDLYSIFGDRMVVATAELRAKLSQGLQGVLFADEGGAWLPGDPVTVDGLKTDGGVGLRFLSPIGPIRFDAAYGAGLKTYVTLGQSF